MNSLGTPYSVERVLEQARTCTVLSHYNPDADAYGSSCGLSIALRGLGKEVTTVNQSGIVPRFRCIPGTSLVRSTLPEPLGDVVIVCDCGDLQRVGDNLVASVKQAPVLINLDHHTSNTQFGHLNLVDERASSTSELVLLLLERMGAISRLSSHHAAEMAKALYAGVLTDTGCFRYSNTSARTFEVAQRLVSLGAVPSEIGEELYGRNTLASVRLQASALAELTLHADGRVCELVVTPEMRNQYQASNEDTDGLVEKGRDIEGVLVSCLMRWDGEIWRISLRSVAERYNVAQVAQSFGGGGHKVAAAFRWRRDFNELRALLREQLVQLVME